MLLSTAGAATACGSEKILPNGRVRRVLATTDPSIALSAFTYALIEGRDQGLTTVG
jgi:hypothetical protein